MRFTSYWQCISLTKINVTITVKQFYIFVVACIKKGLFITPQYHGDLETLVVLCAFPKMISMMVVNSISLK